MNAELLKLYERAKPVIDKRMGEEDAYDRRLCLLDGRRAVVLTCQYNCPKTYHKCKKALRLPLPIDPVNPERGLWGMLDWKQIDIESVYHNGDLKISVAVNGVIRRFFDVAPEIALLKALIAQEGL